MRCTIELTPKKKLSRSKRDVIMVNTNGYRSFYTPVYMFIIIALDSGTIVCSFELSADSVDLFLYFDRNAIGPNRLIHSSFRSGYFFFSLLVGLRWCDAELSDAMRLRWWHKFCPVRFGWITVLEIESIYFISMRLPRFETKDERGKDKKSDGIYTFVDFFVTYIRS